MADIRLKPMKRGDAFSQAITMRDGLGALITGAVSKLKSQVRTKQDQFVAELVITEPSTLGTYIFVATKTSDWPIDTLVMDIEYTVVAGALPISSDNIQIPVLMDVTHG